MPQNKMLQWSHVLPNVETLLAGCGLIYASVASMEPRPSERGNNSTRLARVTKFRPASMEPRPSERGNYFYYGSIDNTYSGFNGATSFRTWKLLEPVWKFRWMLWRRAVGASS